MRVYFNSMATYLCLLFLPQQLAKALSVVEEQKEAAELSRFEESSRNADLQDKLICGS